ncbi:hypothetical protein K505DRAFT_348219 [Melanomma pulvis-pyrius CBS 109.77]|uniref:Zn(2)-C6 fungal-type domain-containing protein n=1 Tax=Melanomma pulvis-pyrius CBS 109.77 TaxID=1314802 RepID=A0A6A6XIN0_9PLEO|nr:hypothetical protein K505DRAFT_348219 [Melanomma pulvis-pyrius CBS 109.77]
MSGTADHFEPPARKTRPHKPKVKTGCLTCRVRKIKCDEGKPECQKCVGTGRICDGYVFEIRQQSYEPQNTSSLAIMPRISESSFRPAAFTGTSGEIEVLSQYWRFKDSHGLKNGYEEVAQESLHMSISEPAVRHALVAMGSLAATFAGIRGEPIQNPRSTADFSYSLHQYSKAMVYLAERLGKPDTASRKVALICCRQFIAIEGIQNNYLAMLMHLIRGLRIMHECRARPRLDEKGNLIRADQFGLLLPDTFVISLFSAPFPAVKHDSSVPGEDSSGKGTSNSEFEVLLHSSRKALLPISVDTLYFLDEVSQLTTSSEAVSILAKKTDLLARLQRWFREFEPQLTAESGPGNPPPRASYLLLNHLIVTGIVLAALNGPFHGAGSNGGINRTSVPWKWA